LNEAGSGATVNFTLFRGQTLMPSAPFPPTMPPMAMPPMPPVLVSPEAFKMLKPLEVSVKMGEAFNPVAAMKMAEAYGMGGQPSSTLPVIARGLETVSLSTKAATHLGASRGGLLVVFVDPQSAAARAGLRAFDVIESVNDKSLNQISWTSAVPAGNPQRLQLVVVRDRQKVEIVIQQQEPRKK
ncbi:MAG TPA: PDZ domain-containing protein, partial [Pyrinomonadaceae bacterium]|nr:PDZ domain-containing protein [Pyrinomonadaceae bacterium]